MMFIYKISNIVNGKIYVGKSVDPVKRWQRHLYLAKKGMRKHLYEAIRKYGEANFQMSVLECCNDADANSRERYWIDHYQSYDRAQGYNKTKGGEGGNTWELNNHKAETSAKLSKKLKGHPVNWDAVRRNAELRRGTTLPKEQRKKISQTLKTKISSGEIIPLPIPHHDRTGEHHTQEAKKKMSEAKAGKSYEEIYGEHALHQRKMRSDAWMGEGNPRYKSIAVETIIELVQNGMTNQEIAARLHIAPQTVWSKLKKAGLTASEIRKEKVNEGNF